MHGFVIALGMFSFGVLIGQFNPVSVVFRYLLNWDATTNTTNASIVTTAGNAGAMAGSYLAPILMTKFNKRPALIYLNILAIITYAFQAASLNLWVNAVAKFFQGIAGGAFSVVSPSLLNDFAPVEIAGPLGGLNQLQVTLGILVPSLMAVPIPGAISGTTQLETPGYEDDFLVKDYWRVLQATPALFSLA